jgi:hypothetical protein
MVGTESVLQHIPRLMTGEPPSDSILPCTQALSVPTLSTESVLTTAKSAGVGGSSIVHPEKWITHDALKTRVRINIILDLIKLKMFNVRIGIWVKNGSNIIYIVQ